MGTRRVWENEPEFDAHTEIDMEWDEDSEEFFKVIEETPEEVREVELALTAKGRQRVLSQIVKIRAQLNGLVDQLDIFNSYGLQTITQNLDHAESTLLLVALDQTEKQKGE